MSLKLDVDYLLSIKSNVVNKSRAVDGIAELIKACHRRSNVLTTNIVTNEDTEKSKKELNTLNETCGILNYLCDILLSLDTTDSACCKSEPWELYIGGEYEPKRKS